MRTHTFRFVAACMLFSLAGQAMGAGIRGKVAAVTVYRGQALVTRVVEVPKDIGANREVVVTDLPGGLEAASLYAEGEQTVKVQSVRYRARPVMVDVNEDVRKIDEKIEDIARKTAANTRHVALLEETRKYVESLQGFVAPTAAAELRNGVLNAETLQKMSGYILSEREKIAEKELVLAKEKQDLDKEMQQAQRERQKLTAGSSRTANEAVVTLAADSGGLSGGGSLKLRYIVNNAGWTPSYAARRETGEKASIRLEYYADITQVSGEDWDGANVTLSTATPSLASRGPQLLPMGVSLASANDEQGQEWAKRSQQMLSNGYEDAKREIASKQKSLNLVLNRAGGQAQSREPQSPGGAVQMDMAAEKKLRKEINEVAADDQLIDLLVNKSVTRGAELAIVPREESLSVTYVIPGAISIPSRADHQLIQIGGMPLKSEFVKVATPALTEYVYDEANVTNQSGMVLLAGPVTAYSDAAFVGRGELPTVSAGESFTVGFGIDSSLRAHKELVERTETTQGGNRVVNVTYRLKLENFGKDAAAVRLLDRMPLAQNKDISVVMGSMTVPLSENTDYAKTKAKTGMLRWDVSVPANGPGNAANMAEFGVEYAFKIEHDKQMMLMGAVQ